MSKSLARLEVNTAELTDALSFLKRVSARRRVALALFDGHFLIWSCGNSNARVAGSGEWTGTAKVNLPDLLSAAAFLVPQQDSVLLEVRDGRLHIGKLSVQCSWTAAGGPTVATRSDPDHSSRKGETANHRARANVTHELVRVSGPQSLYQFTTLVQEIPREMVTVERAVEFKTELREQISKSGVRVADDFRDNLIIDRYDPVFVTMRASKLKHLCSENSEDAVSWNIFRSLRQIDPAAWLPTLAQRGLPSFPTLPVDRVAVSLWLRVDPPVGLADGDEGVSEIDVAVEAPSWVWFIEAKYRSDISRGTTTRPTRDQVLRNIDVGSYYAGVRDFYFSLLVTNPERSPVGVETVNRYADLSVPRSLLSGHRRDGLSNLKAVTLLTWADLGAVLADAKSLARRDDERGYSERALDWLRSKRVIVSTVPRARHLAGRSVERRRSP